MPSPSSETPAAAEGPERRPYVPPRVEELGTLEELTGGGGGGSQLDTSGTSL